MDFSPIMVVKDALMALDSPHDALFKEIFSKPEHAAVELRSALPPAVVEKIDWKTLRLEPSSFVEVGERDRFGDLLFTVDISGRNAFVYVLFEHQSTVDDFMPLRVLGYAVRIWERFRQNAPKEKLLPPILPVLLHHSATGWTKSLSFQELFDQNLLDEAPLRDFLPAFRFILDDVSHQTDEELLRRATREAEKIIPIVLWAFRDARTDRERFLTSLRAWLAAISAAHRAPNGKAAIEAVLYYIARVAEYVTPRDVLAIAESADRETKETFMTLAEQWTQLGIERGRAEGIEKGIEKGERALLVKQLTLKFGPLDDATRATVDAAPLATLELWGERILTAMSLDELFAE